ncbi:TadE/TadG family type IV pilus assembly protein [Pannonibacter sp.]|uniref:TadE/TadG family type IV pilus assembly protein n=1 Tax=Pannonibacter sp. TaxID=1906786 RepID=UPI003F715DE6
MVKVMPNKPESECNPPLRAKGCGPLRRFGKDRKGVLAIEFAFVIVPFLALMAGIIEFGLSFLVNRTLDYAVAESTRLIKTGQAQKASFDKARFKADVCANMATFCDNSRLEIDVRTFDNFASIKNLPPMVGNDGSFAGGMNYTNSTGGQIVVARAVYTWPMFTALLGTDPGDAGTKRFLYSTQVFRNEPFPW